MTRGAWASPGPDVRARLARTSVWLAAAWLLGVSAVKLGWGSPASLPELVREGWLGPELNFRASIAVELAVGLTALVAPRWGALLLTALFSVFLALLAHLSITGADSCGCFGGALRFPPQAMLAIDASLLAFLLFTRPLRALPKSAPRWWLLGLIGVVALALPFAVARGRAAHPRYVVLDPSSWIGRSIHDTPLARFVDTRALAGDRTWILYRVDCEVCAEHLRLASESFASDPKLYVLVEIAERGAEERRTVFATPPAEVLRLPDDIEWVVGTPWELAVESDVVVRAVEGRAEH